MKKSYARLIALLMMLVLFITSCNNSTAVTTLPDIPSTTSTQADLKITPRQTKQYPKDGLYNREGIFEISKSLTGTGGGVEPTKDITPYTGGEITLPVSFRFSAYNDLSNIIITLDGVPQMFTVLQDEPAEGQDIPALNHYLKHPRNIEKATPFTFHVKFTPSVGKTGDILACGMLAMNLPDVWFDPECCDYRGLAKKINRTSSTYLKFEADGNPNQPKPPPHPSGITCSYINTKTLPCNAVIPKDSYQGMTHHVITEAKKGIIVEDNPKPIPYKLFITAKENHKINTICLVDKTPILIGDELSLQHGTIKRGTAVEASLELDVSKATQLHTVMILGNWVGPEERTKSGFMALEGDDPVYTATVFREADFPNHFLKTP